MNGNPFDSLRQLGQWGEQLQRMFGEDFMKNMMAQNGQMPNLPGIQGMSGMPGMPGAKADTAASSPLQNMFGMMGGQYPRTDIYQTKNEVIAVFELPGIERSSDVKLFVEPNRLVVKGNQRIRYSGIPQEQFLVSERQRTFEREIALPVRVLANKVRASYRYGLLEVHMIKDAEQRGEASGSPIPIDFA